MASRLYPLVISVVASVVTGQDKDRMPTMDHTVDLVSHTCGETTQAKQFNFVSPGQLRLRSQVTTLPILSSSRVPSQPGLG